MLRECPIDPARVHFLGRVPYETYKTILQVSAVHVYLTYPFVLSWSMLEAMASGCLLLASRTAPVQEIIRHGENGLLTDFFDHATLAHQVADLLYHPGQTAPLREQAQRDMAAYTLAQGIQQTIMCVM